MQERQEQMFTREKKEKKTMKEANSEWVIKRANQSINQSINRKVQYL
jgi:hypothetical protein